MTAPVPSPVGCVVLGGSAGAIASLNELLPALPEDFDPPLVIVVHLPANGESQLPKHYALRSRLAVLEAEDKLGLARGTVYFAPPGYHLLIERDHSFSLDVAAPVNYSRPSIDVLFSSAASAYGPALLGVLLTGANDDGARGLHAIARAGGTTWVEDPESAEMPAMPRSALELFTPSAVLDLHEIVSSLAVLRTERQAS